MSVQDPQHMSSAVIIIDDEDEVQTCPHMRMLRSYISFTLHIQECTTVILQVTHDEELHWREPLYMSRDACAPLSTSSDGPHIVGQSPRAEPCFRSQAGPSTRSSSGPVRAPRKRQRSSAGTPSSECPRSVDILPVCKCGCPDKPVCSRNSSGHSS